MADYKVVDAKKLEAGLIATADAIREKTGNTEKIDWKENGMADQVDEVFEAGKKSEYDEFWDSYQLEENGDLRSNSNSLFAGFGWTKTTFKPKYDIYPTNANNMFANASCAYMDLTEILQNLGVKLDLSRCTTATNFCQYTSCSRMPELDCRAMDYIGSMFSYATIKIIDKLILREDGSQRLNYPIKECQNLVSVTIEGIIGSNGMNMIKCNKLDKNSNISIINALSPTTSDLIATLSLSSVNSAFETSPGAADGSTSEEWLTLVSTKPNWTISLV